MSPETQLELARRFLALAALHHLALAVVMVIFWIRRRSMERTVAIYFTAAFGTAAVALATSPDGRGAAAVAAGLCGLWALEAAHPSNTLSFRRTPKARLLVMAALGAFAFVYPGCPTGLPAFVFSPLGVTLPPTLLAALAVMNAAAPGTRRPLHWSLAAVGLVVSAAGLFTQSWVHAPLFAASAYAVPLLLGRAKLAEERSEVGATSVSAVRERIHKRRVLFARPRRSSVRRLDVRRRRR